MENDVFCNKFLLSRGRDEMLLRQNGGRNLLLTDLHEDVSRKVLNALKRKTSRQKAFLKRRTAEIFFCRLLELSLRKSRCKLLHI